MAGFDWTPLLQIVVFFVFVIYIVVPIVTAFTLRNAAEPNLIPFDIDDPDLPQEVAGFFHQTVKALSRVGFEPVQAFALTGQVTRAKAVLLLLVNRTTRDMAYVRTFFGTTGVGITLKSKDVAFSSRLADGTVIGTSNGKAFGAFKRRPNYQSIRFPTVSDPERLYRLHQAFVDRHAGGQGKILRLDEEFGGDAHAFQRASIIEEIESQVEASRLYKSPDGKAYWPTWSGAFLMTWGQAPPVKQLRQIVYNFRSARLLRELECESPRLSES
jgi:hypothetical protein